MLVKHKKLHMIGNAHIDPVWLWRWQEGLQEAKATFRSALDRMQEYPDFKFTASSAALYEWVEENDPAMFEEIKERVAEGRWSIVGGWWVEPDCNIPAGESYVRQALYGQRYFAAKFGRKTAVGFNPDSFGHNAMLPQILKKSGLDYYVFMRPHPHEKGLPGRVFWWEAPDGSRVLCFRIPYEYVTWGKSVEKHVLRCAHEIRPPLKELMCFYGVGNHGGGPTRENIESIRELARRQDFPELVFSTPEEFFASIVEQDLSFPVVHDDLQHHASGCYAAHSGVKWWNRRAEHTLLAAEKFSALASWMTGQPYGEGMDRAWKNVLFNQFHDVLAGTSLEEAYEDARDTYGEAMAIAGRSLNHAIQSLAWNVDIPEEPGAKPIVVFNPHAWDSTVPIELEVGGLKDPHELVDDQGQVIPHQLVQSHATTRGRYRVSFRAELPSLGYRVYRLRPEKHRTDFPAVTALDTVMENDFFRLEICPATGCIKSLLDKEAGFSMLAGLGARPAVIEDHSDTWSHDVLNFNDEIGTFQPVEVRRVEHGPVKSVIRVISTYGRSRLVQDFTMYPKLPQIDVKVELDWREQFKLLKLKFPVDLAFRKATYEIPYGTIVRAGDGKEQPGQSWIDLSGIIQGRDERYGLSIINNAKYSYSVLHKEVSITVARSPIYAHHDPMVPAADGHYSYIDQGIQRFTYTLLPHRGSWEEAGTVRRALELNQPAVVLLETFHRGKLPQKASFVTVIPENVVLSVLKKAEDGGDLILRCWEAWGRAVEAEIELPWWQRVIRAQFGPYEIKTFRVRQDCTQPIVETNLLEEPLDVLKGGLSEQ
ncbi:MAG: alpha-mannosidase [Limnochordia bacterium]|jgi:alpha-mannosidase